MNKSGNGVSLRKIVNTRINAKRYIKDAVDTLIENPLQYGFILVKRLITENIYDANFAIFKRRFVNLNLM